VIFSDDAARMVLIQKADQCFWGLIISTIILFVGAIMEYWHPLKRFHTHNVNTRTRERSPRTWVIRSQGAWEKIAVAFVVIGIGGEGIFEYVGARAETAVRNFDNQTAITAGRAADGAVNDFNTAQSQLKALTTQAGDLDTRLQQGFAQLNAVSPRSVLLEIAAPSISQRLLPFAPRKLVVEMCGVSPNDQEKRETWGVLLHILREDAKWGSPENSGLTWGKCPANLLGIVVFLDDLASEKTKKAAKSLSIELQSVLPPQRYFPFLVTGNPKIAPPFDEQGPWEMVEKDPELIVVLVGAREETPQIKIPNSKQSAKP